MRVGIAVVFACSGMTMPSSAGQPPGQPIDEGFFADVHGVEQWVTLRGEDESNPVLVVVAGPGVALSRLALFFAPWEKSFTLVQWDQPGAGSTQTKNGDDETRPLTVERIARDGLAVAELSRRRLGVQKVAVLAISAGTIVGLEMVKSRPDLFFAYVGTGQIVNWARQQELSYRALLERARANGDRQMLAELETIGPPPYDGPAKDAVHSKYAGAPTKAEQDVFAALEPEITASMRTPPPGVRWVPPGSPPVDQRAQATAAYDRLRSQIVSFDARSKGVEFDVPMFFFQGTDDVYTVTSEVETYAAEIRAPAKELVRIDGGGHSCLFLREPFLRELERHLRPLAPR